MYPRIKILCRDCVAKRSSDKLTSVCVTGNQGLVHTLYLCLCEEIRSVLVQKQEDGSNCSILYWSTTLCDKEETFTTDRKECEAVEWAGTLLRLNLERTHFTIRTDHEVLHCILSITETTGRLARSWLRLSKLEFHFFDNAELDHQVANALRCVKTKGENKTLLREEFRVLTTS